MTLTPSRPVPVATDPLQQRLEVELLLGERLLTAAELGEAGPIRWNWSPSLNQEQCEEFTCLPVRQYDGLLVVAIPTTLDRVDRDRLQEIALSQALRMELRLAMKTDIEAILEKPAQAAPKRTPSRLIPAIAAAAMSPFPCWTTSTR